MKTNERDVLLLLLAAGSGGADAWSYLGLGHCFVANMTGNTVLLGMAIAHVGEGDVLHPALALTSYAIGAALGTRIVHPLPKGRLWPNRISLALALEALLLATAEWGWFHSYVSRPTHPLDWPLAAAALAIGIQSGAMLQLKIPGIVTTYISGTWTSLVSGLVLLPAHKERPKEPVKKSEKELGWEERLLLQGALLGIYFASAVLTGWVYRKHEGWTGAIPLAFVILTAGYGWIRD